MRECSIQKFLFVLIIKLTSIWAINLTGPCAFHMTMFALFSRLLFHECILAKYSLSNQAIGQILFAKKNSYLLLIWIRRAQCRRYFPWRLPNSVALLVAWSTYLSMFCEVALKRWATHWLSSIERALRIASSRICHLVSYGSSKRWPWAHIVIVQALRARRAEGREILPDDSNTDTVVIFNTRKTLQIEFVKWAVRSLGSLGGLRANIGFNPNPRMK